MLLTQRRLNKLDTVLEIKNLNVRFKKNKNIYLDIVKNINFSVKKGECVGILGESGSGKSITMRALIGILSNSFDISGDVIFNGKNISGGSKEELRKYRGNKISMIMQNPMICFDPLYRIEDQIKESWLAHRNMGKKDIKIKSLELLEKMNISNGEEVLKKYPHQLSGGMLQRIMIGIAISMEVDLLIADEPTTAIDAITQQEIIKELKYIKDNSDMGMIFITHDLNVISKIADRIIVMNKGEIVDEGSYEYIMNNSEDEYTKQLVNSRNEFIKEYYRILDVGGDCG